ncbi:hypothetical protein ABZ726_22035, partial [Streptomyces hundungensis]|uniref:hypothetical protein n=1 Tax=Streptomyces hundungensis TaxID=1077946 RepID=UPI0033EDAD03
MISPRSSTATSSWLQEREPRHGRPSSSTPAVCAVRAGSKAHPSRAGSSQRRSPSADRKALIRRVVEPHLLDLARQDGVDDAGLDDRDPVDR